MVVRPLKKIFEKEALHVYLLGWDFAMIYALEREFFPRYKLKWRTHKRIHFCLDGHHPVGASQHQKTVQMKGKGASKMASKPQHCPGFTQFKNLF